MKDRYSPNAFVAKSLNSELIRSTFKEMQKRALLDDRELQLAYSIF
jgi:hypothetical protein